VKEAVSTLSPSAASATGAAPSTSSRPALVGMVEWMRSVTLVPVTAATSPPSSIVRAGSPVERFEDLRGHSWSFNEPTSYSGYLATLYHLARMGERGPFFGRAVAAGSHQESIRKVASGEVDASAIDSQVLELELRRHPELRPELRVIESFGPAAIQPVVASDRLDAGLRRDIKSAIRAVSGEPLRACLFESFVSVDDGAYDRMRQAEQQVMAARLTLSANRL